MATGPFFRSNISFFEIPSLCPDVVTKPRLILLRRGSQQNRSRAKFERLAVAYLSRVQSRVSIVVIIQFGGHPVSKRTEGRASPSRSIQVAIASQSPKTPRSESTFPESPSSGSPRNSSSSRSPRSGSCAESAEQRPHCYAVSTSAGLDAGAPQGAEFQARAPASAATPKYLSSRPSDVLNTPVLRSPVLRPADEYASRPMVLRTQVWRSSVLRPSGPAQAGPREVLEGFVRSVRRASAQRVYQRLGRRFAGPASEQG